MNTIFQRQSLYRPTVAVVDLGKLARNTRKLFQAMGRPAFFCPMVKANAYGHGDLEIAKKLRAIGVEHLGVGLVEEALHLREDGDSKSILHFGMFDRHGAKVLIENAITPVISSIEEVQILTAELATVTRQTPLDVHLKINTGMNRLGLAPALALEATRKILAEPKLRLTGVATHFASGEVLSREGSTAHEQLTLFESCVREIKKLGAGDFVQHIANSATARELRLLGREEFGVRPGIAVYGIELPTEAAPQENVFSLEPVLRLESRIVHIQDVRQGGRVSYGGHWQSTRDSKIGVVPIGYADGYHRGLGGGSVLIHGRRASIVGNICMDYFMVDLTDFGAQAKVGDTVVLLGEMQNDKITAQELADRLGSIPYEILTSLSERVPRLYNDDPQSASVF